MICQSLDYLLQDNMKLYGPASTLFPLKVAYKTFQEDSTNAVEQLAWCQSTIARLVSKGLNIASFYFEG